VVATGHRGAGQSRRRISPLPRNCHGPPDDLTGALSTFHTRGALRELTIEREWQAAPDRLGTSLQI
jgi:hypothetical protein